MNAEQSVEYGLMDEVVTSTGAAVGSPGAV